MISTINLRGGRMNNNVKSATVAGLLGIFLGSIGAHCWYLGDKRKVQSMSAWLCRVL